MESNRRKEIDPSSGGVNVSLLESGTQITIVTQNSIYDLVVLKGKEVTLFGGNHKGSTRFFRPKPMIVVGSVNRAEEVKVDWIGLNFRLEFYDPAADVNFRTSSIQRIDIEALDKSWFFTIPESK